MKDITEKITVSFFIRFIGPAIVLFFLIKLSNIEISTKSLLKKDWVQFPFLLVAGAVMHTLYRAIFFEIPINSIKDFFVWVTNFSKIKKCKNHRQQLKSLYEDLEDEITTSKKRLTSQDAEWTWRRIREEFHIEYDSAIIFWASTLHLLYFTGISCVIFTLLEFKFSNELDSKVICSVFFISLITLFGALLSDTCFEKYESHRLASLRREKPNLLRKFLINIFNSDAF